MFDNDDEFGLQSFREDLSYVMGLNSIIVKIYRFNEDKSKYLQGDYFGIRTKSFSDIPELININISSISPDASTEKQHGYSGVGERKFTAMVAYNVEIGNKDIIEFMDDNKNGIKKGAKFRINLGNEGMYKGQFTFKEFEMTLIEEEVGEHSNNDNFNNNNKTL